MLTLVWSASGWAAPVRVAVLTTTAVRTSNDAGLLFGAAEALTAADALVAVDAISMFDSESAEDAIAVAVSGAEKAFDELALLEAVELGERAVGLSVMLETTDALPRAFMVLLQARLAVGDTSGALRTAQLWHRVQAPPDFEAKRAPPTLRELMVTAAAPVPKTGALRIEAAVPGLVRVDGRAVGISPVFVDNLSIGVHLISLEAFGHQRWLRMVDVPPAVGVAVVARPRPAARRRLLQDLHDLLPNELGRDVAGRGLQDVRALFAADQAVLIEARDGRAIGSLFDLQAARRVRSARVELDGDPIGAGRALIAKLYSGLDPRAPGLAAPEEPPPVDDSAPYYTRWWFWPAVAGATIAAVALPLALSSDEGGGLERVDGAGALIIRF
ncbi:MAG: hypothetical protein ACI9U2_003101 [Bradymonadia bacterium]|jgi:hypothetical protein